MYQIDNSTAVAARPDASAAGTAGWFTDGSPSSGVPATILPAEFMNMLMAEVLGLLAAGGLTPDKTNSAQILQALRSAGVFTTAPQFDATTKAATTAFVKQAMGNRSGVSLFSTNQTLTAAAYGGYFESSGASSLTCQLPTPVGAVGGSVLVLCAQSAGTLTVSSASGAFYGPNNPGGTSTVVLQPGTQMEFISDGTNWKAINGAGVATPTSNNGYQKLPSGVIIQWGNFTPAAGGSTLTFPIAFPNSCRSFIGTVSSTFGASYTVVSQSLYGTASIGVQALNSTNSAGTAAPVCWLAIGN